MTKLMMTSKQKKQILRVLEDELDKLGPTRDAAQAILFQGNKLQAAFRNFVADLADPILKLISGDGGIVIDAVDGSETLADANDVFGYIDSDFKNYGTDEPGIPTNKTPVRVHEIVKDATFVQIFGSLSGDLNKLCLTQAQIKYFCMKHRTWLCTYGYGTLFLFKSKNTFFVAGVGVNSGDTLEVNVDRLEDSHVWHAENRRRVVVPQLA